MAHQPEIIPWHLLACNLRYSDGKSRECACKTTNLHPRARPEQGVELTQFVQAFSKAIDEAATRERAKYPKYDPPNPSDVLLDEQIVKKIEHDVIQWREDGHAVDAGFVKDPPIPQETRTASAFFHGQETNDCGRFEEINGKGFFNLEIAKSLIIHGEMEPVLRACAHEEMALGSWEQAAQCHCMAMEYDAGWDMLYKHALSAYLCLNVTYCFPEVWDETAGRTNRKDYRHMKSYQYILRDCTAPRTTSEVVTYPHRWFFGIAPDQFHAMGPTVADKERWLDKLDIDSQNAKLKKDHYGLLPFDDFLTLENPTLEYMPSTSDVSAVQHVLLWYLPIELVLPIMKMAGYKPKRALTISHDPLHPSNRMALDEYLENCWQILVRCEMLAKEMDHKIADAEGWQRLISSRICLLWEAKKCEGAELLHYVYERRAYEFIGAYVPDFENQAQE